MKNVRLGVLATYLLLGTVSARTAQQTPNVAGKQVVIGSAMPLKKEDNFLRKGIEAAFRAANETNLLPGQEMALAVEDDKKSIAQSVSKIKELLSKTNMFLNVYTQGVTQRLLPELQEGKLLLFSPHDNNYAIRKPDYKFLIHARPSILDEIEILIEYVEEVLAKSPDRIAVYYEDSVWGQSGRDAVRAILQEKYQTKPYIEVSHARGMIKVDEALKQLVKAVPEALICIAGRYSTYRLLTQLVNHDLTRMAFAGVSHLLPIQKYLYNARGIKLAATSTIPSLEFHKDLEIVQAFKRDFKKYFPDKELSVIAFEGYVCASIFLELVRKNPNQIEPSQIIAAAESIKHQPFKGLLLHFEPKTRNLFHQLWISPGHKEEWIAKSRVVPPAIPEKNNGKQLEEKKVDETARPPERKLA